MNLENETPSPCVRKCCLNENDICLGCFRHIDEIVGWSKMTEIEKRKIIENCNLREQKEK
ncbi:DUF1289 domain-containing protein [Thalassotalea marina]|uniref:DUF1289 domain-containing protein n=1 Tax=Thalassotalea marina TaxID=1673741 RepID=A0A919BEQ4_9GAMM|nr:DUF1289 domain-containing protein [Thalassotalea marina]GHF87188.1 hypothetical protein GCM10017161_13370 [Thalassotalea marina]